MKLFPEFWNLDQILVFTSDGAGFLVPFLVPLCLAGSAPLPPLL